MNDNVEIYKKWRKNDYGAGFIKFVNWTSGGKVTIEIGENDPKTDASKSVSTVYVPTMKLLAYLHAEVNGTIDKIYPTLLQADKYKHGVTYFGITDVARVFKIEDWAFDAQAGTWKTEPGKARRFKAGVFKTKEGKQGKEPDYSNPISRDMIQMKPEELAELYQHLLLVQQAYENAWMISGETRKDFDKKVQERAKARRAEGNYD